MIDRDKMLEGTGTKRKGHSFMDGPTTNPVKIHEERVARVIGGHRQVASGAFLGRSGDAVSDDFQCECKRTGRMTISIRKEWLMKISLIAKGNGKIPMFSFEFEEMPKGIAKTWVAIPASDMKQLLERPQE